MSINRIGRVTRGYRPEQFEPFEEPKTGKPVVAQRKLVGQPDVPIRQSSASSAPSNAVVPKRASPSARRAARTASAHSEWSELQDQARKSKPRKRLRFNFFDD